jgi:uncharacterized protein YjbI with pentapeptide repeats
MHLTYANVMVTLLAIGALTGGVAYAANTVFSTDIVDGEVKTADLDTNSVRTSGIAAGRVQSADVKNDSLTGGDITDSSLTGTEIAHSSLTGADLASASIEEGNLSPESVTGSEPATARLLAAPCVPGSLGRVQRSDLLVLQVMTFSKSCSRRPLPAS